MENHEPDDILQTSLLFEEGLRVMPSDPILRQMISASCLGQVVKGRSPKGKFCDAVAPVRWTVDVPPPPSGVPEWAVTQRQLMRRLSGVTAATGPSTTDFSGELDAINLAWTAQVLNGGTTVVWTTSALVPEISGA